MDDRPRSRTRRNTDEYVGSPPQRSASSKRVSGDDEYAARREDDGSGRGYRNTNNGHGMSRNDRERYVEERANDDDDDDQVGRAHKTPMSRGNDRVRYADERAQGVGAMKPYMDRDDVRVHNNNNNNITNNVANNNNNTKVREQDESPRVGGRGVSAKGRDQGLEDDSPRVSRTMLQSQRSEGQLSSSQVRMSELQQGKPQAYAGDSEAQNQNMHNNDRTQQQQQQQQQGQNERLQRENSNGERLQREGSNNFNGSQGYAEVQTFDSDTVVSTPRRSNNTSQKAVLRSSVEYNNKEEHVHDVDMHVHTSRRREMDAMQSTNSSISNTSNAQQRMPAASTTGQKVMLQGGGGRDYDAPQGSENHNNVQQRVQLGSTAHKVMLLGGRDYDAPQGSESNYNSGGGGGMGGGPRDQDARKRGSRVDESSAVNSSLTVCVCVRVRVRGCMYGASSNHMQAC
jgi:hypothetical protein